MEHEFHSWLKAYCTDNPFRWVRQGIGDDAAVIATERLGDEVGEGFDMVVSSDMIAEGTHFRVAYDDLASLKQIGRKLVAVNLSDIAAMGATPRFITLNFQLPRTFDLDQAVAVFEGASELTRQYGVSIIGGDTNSWDGPMVLSATITGIRPSTQSGWGLSNAQVGDAILASGNFGGSIFGRHLTFEPRIELATYLAKHFTIRAATDATDSLTIDLMAIAKASRVGMQVDLASIPISADVDGFEEPEDRSIVHALHDGEDFELLFTACPRIAQRILQDPHLPTAVTRIGTVIEGEARLLDQNGNAVKIAGYIH